MFKNHEKCQLGLVEGMEGKMCHVTRGADPVWSPHESLWFSGGSLDSGQMFDIFIDSFSQAEHYLLTLRQLA